MDAELGGPPTDIADRENTLGSLEELKKADEVTARDDSPRPADSRRVPHSHPRPDRRRRSARVGILREGVFRQEEGRISSFEGKILHAEFQIGDSIFMLSDEFPAMGNRSPKSLGGSPAGVWLYAPDVDDTYRRAVTVGATSVVPPTDLFWGDRHARVRDPFGHEWSIATHREDVTRGTWRSAPRSSTLK